MVAMWMKKSRQVWTASWGAWTSSTGGSFAALAGMQRTDAERGPTEGLDECNASVCGLWRGIRMKS
jgi:hypothetical protein